ncbi:hypothetical protein V8J88_13095 [Massilia sp. W12]|uniref:hypothetical protein n=1 Tax=Massilia sp. W12 TaxID=3126507 RepID=UPI0030CBF537
MKRNLMAVSAAALLSLPAYGGDGVALDNGWLTMRDVNLEIKAGSPLDFSLQFPEQEGGVKQAVSISPEGRFQIGAREQRFMCAPMVFGMPYGGYPDKTQAERYAAQLKRAGYNLVRLMYIEANLMHNSGEDFDYDAEQLERLHYFLAALKREGIYWMLDAQSSENGSLGGVFPHRWVKKHNLLVRLYYDPAAQQHWRDQVEKLFARVNPHTGKSILADEALFGMILVNEGGLQFLSHVRRKVPDELMPHLQQWLKKRYPKGADFEKVWKQSPAVLEQGGLKLPSHSERSPQMDDVLAFFLELHSNTAQWMQAHLRKLGYKGPLTSFNNNPTSLNMRSRALFNWADMHIYHDEAFGKEPGAKMHNDSAFDKNLQHITTLAVNRLAGRAYTISEYGQPFWNEWRREAILVPSYAAMQNWDAVCQHASTAVDLTYAHSKGWKQSIHPYAVGLDPVLRAGETLAALLYRRGDIKAASAVAEITLPGGKEESSARYWGIGREVERNALVMRTQTRLGDDGSKPHPAALAKLSVNAESKVGRKVDQLLAKIGIGGEQDEFDKLAKQSAPDNRTQAAAGVFQSSTGQLLAKMKQRQFEIRTPKTEAALFEDVGKGLSLGTLQIKSSDAPALVSLSALDAANLDKSKKMLLIVATDALNTGMRFTSAKRQELVRLGSLPARIKPIAARLEIGGKNGRLQVQAMRQNGELTDMLPVQETASGWLVDLDMAKLSSGPGFYFLVTRN